MYSVEDLLISHGYKPARSSHREATEARPGRGGASGRAESANTEASLSSRQAHSCPSDGKHGERSWRREEGEGSGNHGDARTQGGFLTAGGGFCDGPYGLYCHPRSDRDVSYWRRRGQDFSVPLDYADSQSKTDAPRKVERRSEWQAWEETMWPRGRAAGSREPWMAAGDRKCQSLGTEEWRSAIGLGRQLSDSESQVWAHEQYQQRPSEGAIHPKTKGKSLSLPRGLPTESLTVYGSQHADSSGFLGSYQKHPESAASHELWTENSRSLGHASLLPKPMFSRPVKPPSYEAHQQTRGSWEMLAGDLGPRPRDRVIRLSKSGEFSQEYFAHPPSESALGPPGYIPPPSYTRPQLQNGAQMNHSQVCGFPLKGEAEPGAWEVGKWPCRSVGGSWMEYQQERGVACGRQAYPGYVDQHLGCVQYLPFHDPRVRHISGGQWGNSLTDSDKIRNIHREVPSAKVLGQSTRDSAFFPPEGLTPSTDPSEASPNDNDVGNTWNSCVHKGSNNSVATDQNCNENHKAFPSISSRENENENGNVDQGFPEAIAQVKKIEPAAEAEKPKQVKRKVNETIFCLVSIPVHLQPDRKCSDVNNNETLNTAELSNPIKNDTSHLQSQSLPSTLSTGSELQQPLGSITEEKPLRKVCSKKEVLDTRSVKLSKHIELRYSGSWPGDQYRDQETQTSFCEAPEYSLQGPPSLQAQDQGQSASKVAAETSLGADCGSTLTFHAMKGQKSLNPSSNSAFSRTSTYSNRFTKSTALPGLVSGNSKGKDTGPEVFGQFLLKPVSRRPWDAIEELESFNKELQSPLSKSTSVDKCIEDLNEAYKDILELSNTSNNFENFKIQDLELMEDNENVQEESHAKSKKIRPTIKSWTASADREYRGVKSAFSRTTGKAVSFSNQQQLEEVSGLLESGFINYSVPSQILKKVDILVQREPQRRDVGVTVHPSVEPMWVAGKLMQDASTLTSPPDYEDICHALQLTRDVGGWNRATPIKPTAGNPDRGSPQNLCKTAGLSLAFKQGDFCCRTEAKAEGKRESSAPQFAMAKNSNILSVRGHRPRNPDSSRCIAHNKMAEAEDPSGVNSGNSSDQFYWRRQLSLAERHLETLLINETASNAPLEDLSTLYQVKCAQGIPENESLEERAARILGINVPAECLGVVNPNKCGEEAKEAREMENQALPSKESSEPNAGASLSHLLMQSEKTSDAQELDARVQEMEKVEPSSDGPIDSIFVENTPGLNESPENEIQLSAHIGRNDRLSPSDGQVKNPGQEQDASASTNETGHPEVDLESQLRHLSTSTSDFGDGVESWSHPAAELDDHLPVSHQPRTVAKREIMLPPGPCSTSSEAGMKDVEMQSLSDSYDPSHVETV